MLNCQLQLSKIFTEKIMEKIAIIGLSCLFPEAKNPEEFWQNLLAAKDSTSQITIEDLGLDPALFYDSDRGKPDKFYSRQGGYIRNFDFQPGEYHLPSEFLESLDDTFKWSLYTAKQALQHSGYLSNKSVLAKCGVILGNLSSPTKSSYQLFAPLYQQAIEPAIGQLLQQKDFHLASIPTKKGKISLHNAAISSLPAALIARAFSLSDINFCLDAACSSSFYAIKLASHYLWSDRADLMLAGAISCGEPLSMRLGFSSLQAYSDTEITRPFDRNSRGIITADGVGIVVLKRYGDAIRDGDRILATICGNGLSNDGRGKHLLSPNSKGQILAFERAYQEANINPREIDYLECHATGTPIGDPTELSSIETFFGKHQASPLLGGAKANVGHLLTASGMVSLTKTILSMQNGVIPPSINIKEPLTSKNGGISPRDIVRSTRSWPDRSSIKRAGINAFGFGGSNSHLIIEVGKTPETVDISDRNKSKSIPPAKIAIIGMDAFFGSCDGLDAFEKSIYEGKQHFIPLPDLRWHGIENQESLFEKYNLLKDNKAPMGAYLQDFDIDTIACKIPPIAAEKLNPQNTLILKVASRAIQDAGLPEGGNVAVIIGAETELSIHGIYQRWNMSWQLQEGLLSHNIFLSPERFAELETMLKDSIEEATDGTHTMSYNSNIMANRISALWNFTGPSFSVSAGENSAFKALEVAQMLLTTKQVDAVVVGAIDLAGNAENIWWRTQLAGINTGVNTLSYDRSCNGWSIGEGAGAIVIKRQDIATANGDRIYAAIDAIGFARDNLTESELNNNLLTPNDRTVRQACQQAFEIAKIRPEDINYLEVFGSGIPTEDEAEISGLLATYGQSENSLNCAIGSVKANIGHTFVASGIASLIKTVLCLYHRYIPATPNWTGVKQPKLWEGSPFYVAPESRPWFKNKKDSSRVAAINSLGIDGTSAHVILSESPSNSKRSSHYLSKKSFYLFPLAANDRTELLAQLESLQGSISSASSLSMLAFSSFKAFQQKRSPHYVLAILGHNQQELAREIEFARQGISKAFGTEGDWQTPVGSYFTAKPLGKKGEIALVYPGSASSFLGIGRDLFRLLPKIYEDIENNDNPSLRANIDKLINPRSLNKLSLKQLKDREQQFLKNLTAMSETEIGLANIYTVMLQNIFQIKPKMAFGSSLGEASMFFAQGVWKANRQENNPLNSYVFSNRLSGPKNAVREYWGLPKLSESSESADRDFWGSYFLMANLSQVKECLKNENRVYLTEIQASDEILIAGDPQGCQRAIKTLGCNALSTSFDHVMHCEPMQSEYDELVKLMTFPIQNRPNLIFYSSSEYQPISLDSSISLAHNAARVCCQQVDFPRLVNRVYDDGAKIFIELGASSNASRVINKILGDREHISLFLNKKGIDDHTSIVKALAKLVSHGVNLDLSPLYDRSEVISTPINSTIKNITLGGHRIIERILSEENRQLCQNLSSKPAQKPKQVNAGIDREALKPLQNVLEKDSKSLEKLRSHLTSSSSLDRLQYQKLIENAAKVAHNHKALLKARQESSQKMSEIILLQIACARTLISERKQ